MHIKKTKERQFNLVYGISLLFLKRYIVILSKTKFSKKLKHHSKLLKNYVPVNSMCAWNLDGSSSSHDQGKEWMCIIDQGRRIDVVIDDC